jgi:hypothetical protein
MDSRRRYDGAVHRARRVSERLCGTSPLTHSRQHRFSLVRRRNRQVHFTVANWQNCEVFLEKRFHDRVQHSTV